MDDRITWARLARRTKITLRALMAEPPVHGVSERRAAPHGYVVVQTFSLLQPSRLEPRRLLNCSCGFCRSQEGMLG
jgi:hypothetical protein